MTPSVNPHPMVTRAKDGFRLPRDRLTLVATASSTAFRQSDLCPRHPCRSKLARGYGGVWGLDELVPMVTWELVPRPHGSNVIIGKWVFTHKFLSDGTFDRYKARWVLRGFTQRPGLDHDETFSSVVEPATVHTVLALAASRAWLIQQLDVKNAFLHDTLSETIFCSQPTGFANLDKPDLVCHLNKSLYGLKQAPRVWYSRFATCLTSLGFIEAKSDTSLFILRCGPDMVYQLLYIDDIILPASSSELLCRTIAALQWEFAMKDLGPLHHFLGITVEHHPDRLFLHQRTYTQDVIKRAAMANCKPCTTPINLQAKLAADSGPPVQDASWF
jgi:hypothetical protein